MSRVPAAGILLKKRHSCRFLKSAQRKFFMGEAASSPLPPDAGTRVRKISRTDAFRADSAFPRAARFRESGKMPLLPCASLGVYRVPASQLENYASRRNASRRNRDGGAER